MISGTGRSTTFDYSSLPSAATTARPLPNDRERTHRGHDSGLFPVDHLTRKSDPVTPVTTPSREASPTFLEEICTRSPTTAMYRMVPRRGMSD